MSLTRHLTFANTCSLLALVVALGTGTAYAAATVRSSDIVDGQVRTVDLGANAVTGARIAPGAVKADDLASGSVTGGTVKDGSLGPLDVLDQSLTGDEVSNGSLTAADLAVDAVGGSELQAGSVDGDEILDGSVTAADLAADSVGASELGDNVVSGGSVVNDSLTAADLAGGLATGSVSVPAGAVSNGRCEDFTVTIGGSAEAGDAVVVSVRAPMQDGVFFYGTQVASPSSTVVMLCNLSGGAMNAITNLPIRLITLR
ncbi:hypothetical protein GCM10023340_45160 [Nocardioides marinquilinus]|uniref:Pentapeptide repeat-containing protein n=1 Tax=Nocardioides marinquilinus TaxID=1210400 RepID=A0ABP9Q4I9_9ACTN